MQYVRVTQEEIDAHAAYCRRPKGGSRRKPRRHLSLKTLWRLAVRASKQPHGPTVEEGEFFDLKKPWMVYEQVGTIVYCRHCEKVCPAYTPTATGALSCTNVCAKCGYYARRKSLSKDDRRYLLECDINECVYCGASGRDVPLQIEHIVPFLVGGSNELCNLALSCRSCNLKKARMPNLPLIYGRMRASN